MSSARDQSVTNFGGWATTSGPDTPRLTCRNAWSGRRESNPHHQLGRLGLCH